MTDPEFLDDRDCTPSPKGETPRTDALVERARTMSEVLDECERLERELTRALRVVEAARRYANFRDTHAGSNLIWCVREWEAGR